MDDRLDLVILGATGFTGKHCIPYVYKLSKSDGRNLTWGIAGRSREKLEEVLETMGKKIDADLSNIAVITCDIKDKKSLLEMAKRAKIVINCCGPYRYLGEAIIEACIEVGTHQVDISAEPQHIIKTLLEYDEKAKEKGVYVINACGFDCIPSDLGTVYLEENFDGVLNSVVIYVEVWVEGEWKSGSALNYGTWASAVHAAANWGELRDLNEKLFPEKWNFEPKLKRKFYLHKSSFVDWWVLPFPTVDCSLIRHSQRYFYENYAKRPVQADTLFVLKPMLYLMALLVFGAIFIVLTRFNCGVKLLLDYPRFFTCGVFNKEPPSEEITNRSRFQFTIYGEGWKEKSANKDNQYTIPPNKVIVGRVKGKDPGYSATAACLVGSAITIATEKHKMPRDGVGGVYSPGAAFAKTSLIKLLNDNDVTFEIISQKDI